MKKIYTSTEVLKATNIKPSQLAYLTREGIIPCHRRGKGISVLYPIEAIKIITARQKAVNDQPDIDVEDM